MHAVDPKLLRGPVNVQLVGAGGTGSALFVKLVNLHFTLQAFGYPGLHVTLYDDKTVTEGNLVRSAFFPADLGRAKADVLVNRVNLSYGLGWRAVPEKAERVDYDASLLLACVDTRVARAQLAHSVAEDRHSLLYLADSGNSDRYGQTLLGQPPRSKHRGDTPRLPHAYELFPDLTDTAQPEDDSPSCGTLESLERQDLYINETLALTLANLLWKLFRDGGISHHGAYVNLETGATTPIGVDPVYWRKVKRRNRRAAQGAT